jgi:predicted dehydrogenase
MKPIKLGIIGCGIAARELHLPALNKLKDKFVITAVCNHTEQKAKSFSNLVGGVPYMLDYHDLLNRDDVEAVDIILPIEMNYQVTKESLQAGKHVIVEKPLAVNLIEAKAMLEFPNRFNLKMMVAENYRYRPIYRRLKSLLDSGAIGSPYSVFWNIYRFVDTSGKFAQTKWRINHKYKGGFITDGGVHQIAALRDLFGDFFSGNCFTNCINPSIGELDTFCLQFNTTKIQGVLNIFYSSIGHSEDKLIILGNKGTIIIDGNKLTIKLKKKQDIDEIIDDDGGYSGQFINFHQALRYNKKIVSTFSEAYKDLETILKAIEAAETGEKVDFK